MKNKNLEVIPGFTVSRLLAGNLLYQMCGAKQANLEASDTIARNQEQRSYSEATGALEWDKDCRGLMRLVREANYGCIMQCRPEENPNWFKRGYAEDLMVSSKRTVTRWKDLGLPHQLLDLLARLKVHPPAKARALARIALRLGWEELLAFEKVYPEDDSPRIALLGYAAKLAVRLDQNAWLLAMSNPFLHELLRLKSHQRFEQYKGDKQEQSIPLRISACTEYSFTSLYKFTPREAAEFMVDMFLEVGILGRKFRPSNTRDNWDICQMIREVVKLHVN